MLVRYFCALVPLVLLAAQARAVPVMPPSKEQINQWITQLGDRSFAVRERAQNNLWQAGAVVEEPLRKVAAESGDKEVVRRANEILDKFKWGLYPDTPKKMVELIGQYQATDHNGRLNLIPTFLDEGAPGARALLKAVAAEDNRDLRNQLQGKVNAEMSRTLPRLLTENEHAVIEAMVELGLHHNGEHGLSNYVAYYTLRGKLADRIAHFQTLLAKDPDNALYPPILFYLHRANGDVAAARMATEKINDKIKRNHLLVGLAMEQDDWKEAARVYTGEGLPPLERLGMKAALLRLAGDTKELEAAVKELQEIGQKGEGDTTERWGVAKALFINRRPDDALQFVAARSTTRAEIMLALYRFKEALDACGYNRKTTEEIEPNFDFMAARILAVQGEKEKASELLATYAKRIDSKKPPEWIEQLLTTMVRTGNRQAAEDVLAELLKQGNDIVIPQYWWRPLFGDDMDIASRWWKALRQVKPEEAESKTLQSLRKLLAGEIKGKDLDALFTALGEAPNDDNHCRAVGLVALRAGDDKRAERFLRQLLDVGTSNDAVTQLGNWWAGKKKWKEAADAYRLGWERDRKQPLPLFLQGWALVQAGQTKDGERLIEQAHWLPLGNDAVREYFAEELADRGHSKHAERERLLLLKTCPVGAYYSGEARRQLALAALDGKDYLKAAAGQEHALLRILASNVTFLDDSAYVGVPHYIHRQRAHGLILAGKFDEGMKEVELCLTLMPNEVEMPLAVIPALESKGKKKEADALYARSLKGMQQLCKDNPKCAAVNNSVGWQCAVLRRDIDEGLKHAKRAVELEPERTAYRDTLAELWFQKGDKEKAIAEMKKCLEQEPKKEFYIKQLKRMEAGDPKAPLPPENE